MEVCQITDEDISYTADMTRQLFEDEPSNKHLTTEEFELRIRTYLENGCEAFHFKEDGKIVGYALVNKDKTPYYLIDFFICRNARRSGNGRRSFHALVEHLNTEKLDLDVFCWNSRARKFWESLGFKELAVIMRRQEE